MDGVVGGRDQGAPVPSAPMWNRMIGLMTAAVLVAACGATVPAQEAPSSLEQAVTAPGQPSGQQTTPAEGTEDSTPVAASADAQAVPGGTSQGDLEAGRRGADSTVAPVAPQDQWGAPEGAEPVRVVIPAIGVDAPIIGLGLEDDGALEVPSDFDDTGYYTGGPRPGAVGPAIVAGHVDSRSGPAVFYRLHELVRGDVVDVVYDTGWITRFVVTATEQHPKDAFPTQRVYGNTDVPAIRLITCGGDFDRDSGHYRDNRIVYGHLVAAGSGA